MSDVEREDLLSTEKVASMMPVLRFRSELGFVLVLGLGLVLGSRVGLGFVLVLGPRLGSGSGLGPVRACYSANARLRVRASANIHAAGGRGAARG